MSFTLQDLINAGLPAIFTDGIKNTEFSRGLTDVEWKTYLTISDPERVEFLTLKEQYQAMIGRLEVIQSVTNPTNAQIVQAIKDEALYIERIMKVLKNILK